MGFIVVILIIVAFIIYKKRSKKESGEIFSEESLVNSINELNDKIAERNNTIKEIQEVNSNCEKRMEGIKNAISSAEKEKKIKELQGKVDEAAPWFEMTAAEQEKKEAELKAAKEAKEKEEAEKLAAEQKKKEEEEKKGYDTGITYSQLARTPDGYLAKKVKFSGKVVQVMEDGDSVGIRLAVDGDYDNIILGTFDSSIISERILEDDYITVYGLSAGIYTYESTMGASISVPSMTIDKISR